mgnify:CR=1 FL=1
MSDIVKKGFFRRCLYRATGAYLLEQHIQMLEQQVKSSSPDLLLKKGYSITLKNGKAVTDASQLLPGDEVTTRVAKGEFKSKVI